ncbi:MAG: hypothetical protein RI901_928 [Actinomycetota bacterium]|jgi:hypothetical protein
MKAEIINTGNTLISAARIIINKPSSELFNFIANPKNHPKIDGSKMVRGKAYGPKRLSMNSWFVMRQLRTIPYFMPNKVVEFEEGKLIAWRNASPSRWRYEFVTQSDGSTQVTQYLDCSRTPSKLAKSELSWAAKAMAKTLVRFKEHIE